MNNTFLQNYTSINGVSNIFSNDINNSDLITTNALIVNGVNITNNGLMDQLVILVQLEKQDQPEKLDQSGFKEFKDHKVQEVVKEMMGTRATMETEVQQVQLVLMVPFWVWRR